MDDFRNEYKGNKRRGAGWTIVLTIFSLLALVFSTVALYRSNQMVAGVDDENQVQIKVATTNVSSDGGTGVAESGNVVGVADAMSNKVVYIGVYGKSSSFTNSVQYAQIGSGSGFIVSKDGYVVTNYHVLEDGTSYKVKLENTEYDAKIVGYDSYSDIAVLQIQGANKEFESVVLGDSNSVKVGELAIAIGSPLGETLNNSVTVGYVSAKDREIINNSHTARMIQTDAAINPGNSGGPLLNSAGQVIGINTMKSAFAGYDEYGNAISADGISFAIPISDAMPIITEIIQTGSYKRPGIGISYYTIDAETARRNNIPQGLLVREIVKDGPAEKAGIKADDIIISVEDKTVVSGTELNSILASKKIGDKLKIKVRRGNEDVDIDLTLGDLTEISKASTNSTQQNNNNNNDRNNNGYYGGQWVWPF